MLLPTVVASSARSCPNDANGVVRRAGLLRGCKRLRRQQRGRIIGTVTWRLHVYIVSTLLPYFLKHFRCRRSLTWATREGSRLVSPVKVAPAHWVDFASVASTREACHFTPPSPRRAAGKVWACAERRQASRQHIQCVRGFRQRCVAPARGTSRRDEGILLGSMTKRYEISIWKGSNKCPEFFNVCT